jgi:hypothetical protein
MGWISTIDMAMEEALQIMKPTIDEIEQDIVENEVILNELINVVMYRKGHNVSFIDSNSDVLS